MPIFTGRGSCGRSAGPGWQAAGRSRSDLHLNRVTRKRRDLNERNSMLLSKTNSMASTPLGCDKPLSRQTPRSDAKLRNVHRHLYTQFEQ